MTTRPLERSPRDSACAKSPTTVFELEFRDSLTVMDSRFLPAFAGMTGNDVTIEREPSLPPTTTVTPAVSVIPAQAGIQGLS